MTEPLKSNRGRPRNTIPSHDWHVYIQQDLALFFSMHFYDEFTKKEKHGKRNELINRLLREEMDRLLAEKGAKP